MGKYTPFDYVKAIRRAGDIPEDMSGYNQFIINKALYASARNIDTVALVNCMKGLTNEQHFAFLYTTIPQGGRYIPWMKAPKDDYLEVAMRYFHCNADKARQYLHLLTDDEIQEMLHSFDEGGEEKSSA